MKQCLWIFLCGAVFVTGPVIAQEKGKAEKQTPPVVDESKDKETEDESQDKKRDESRRALEELGGGGGGEQDPILELVDEIGKNMKSIEELLNQPNTGQATQDLNNQTIDQIEKLIEEVQKRGTS